jgi:polyferredoxin
MKLIWNWREILRRAWSIRLMLLAALLSGVEVALPFFMDSMPRGIFAGLSFLVVASAFVARLIAQKGLSE